MISSCATPRRWLIEIDCFVVDARALPAHIQLEVRRGLIPDVPVTASA